jgi:hypothetical protein
MLVVEPKGAIRACVFILDFNVRSHVTRPLPNRRVFARLDGFNEDWTLFSVVSLTEIRRGNALSCSSAGRPRNVTNDRCGGRHHGNSVRPESHLSRLLRLLI